MKKVYLLQSTDFERLKQIKGNPMNKCDLFKSSQFLSGAASMIAGPRASKNLPTPLRRR
jgi:hypothetical protein